MKRLFHIEPANGSSRGNVLLCELSHHHICLALADESSRKVSTLSYFECVHPLSVADFSAAISQMPSFEKIYVSSAFPEVVLLPEHLFTKKKAAEHLQLTEEVLQDPVFYNILDDQNVVVVYSLPREIKNTIDPQKESGNIHVYTCQLKQEVKHAQDQMLVHFESREFRVLAKKDQQLLVAQTYSYTAPLDVVYFLLAISREFDLPQSGTAVVLSGLVDEDSALYKELHQYFSNILFATAENTTIPANSFPSHFFSSMHNLAACVL